MAGFLNFAGPSARGWTLASGGRLLLIRGLSLGLGLAGQVDAASGTFLTKLWSPVVVDGIVGAVDGEISVDLDTVAWPSDFGWSDAPVGWP